MTKKKIKDKSDSKSEESSSYQKEEEKANKRKQRCPKCGLQFLYLSRHKKCKYLRKEQSTPMNIPSHNFGNNMNFYRSLYIFINEKDISLNVTVKAFEKVIETEIQQVIDKEAYTGNLLERFKEIKSKEIDNFNETFVEYYNEQKENDDTESASIEDINEDIDEKRKIVFMKIKELRHKRIRTGKMCKSCFNFFSLLQGHVFYDASCKEFIQSIVDEESYFKKRSLIFNQMKYVYRIKFRNAKLPRIFKLIDSCYDKYSNSNEDEFMKIKKILKLLGDRITKNDY